MGSTLHVPRVEHIGSFLRPQHLVQVRAAFDQGRCSAEELKACEDQAISEAVRMQLDLGLPTITDGELRRAIFYEGVFDKLSGLKDVPNAPPHMFQQGNLRRDVPLYGDAFDSLKRIAGPENVHKLKVTMGAPEWFHFRHGKYTYEPGVYANDGQYFADVARMYREEIKDLYARGCRAVQIDDPVMGCFCDEDIHRRMREAGVDPARLLDMYLGVINDCLRDRPKGMIAGLHVCRGNVKPDRSGFAVGPYDFIAQAMFEKVDADVFYLEYDDMRSGGFGPLRHLPRGRSVVLGLVSSKTPKLEDAHALRERIEEAADAVTRGGVYKTRQEALAQLSLSPQCGFSSNSKVSFMAHDDMVAKLALVRDVALSIWGTTD
ncbi:UROD/MetE-like protein [Epithele typhae]|uniref:UROD/MetE-like protein n=1 Tax=Epithele typhae TaxID=378194 RepID=UPI002007CD2A|nr:UROD/MetE-like protein [Epithele typhae]KAH9917152.1 UROD/MetE-like protein [Epithele typhae]